MLLVDMNFQEMYNCLTDDQRKYFSEKERLTRQIKEKETQYQSEKDNLDGKNKELEKGEYYCVQECARNDENSAD